MLFYDGKIVAAREISGVGDNSSGLSTAVGTDGMFGGVWANWFPGMIDDVLIWRRVVTPPEAEEIYQEGLAGKTFGQVPLRITAVDYDPAAEAVRTLLITAAVALLAGSRIVSRKQYVLPA